MEYVMQIRTDGSMIQFPFDSQAQCVAAFETWPKARRETGRLVFCHHEVICDYREDHNRKGKVTHQKDW